jgi:hypothetical protein
MAPFGEIPGSGRPEFHNFRKGLLAIQLCHRGLQARGNIDGSFGRSGPGKVYQRGKEIRQLQQASGCSQGSGRVAQPVQRIWIS